MKEEGAGINEATKYVASNTLTSHEWNKSVFLSGNVADEIKKLKGQDGPELQVHGSGELIQTLLEHDLVDEFWLKIFPVTLGTGKRLFDKGTIPAAYTLVDSRNFAQWSDHCDAQTCGRSQNRIILNKDYLGSGWWIYWSQN